MNTNSPEQHPIHPRKAQHHEICINKESNIETGSTWLDHVRFVHHALPQLHADEISTAVDFLGYRIKLPFFISCMTGGSRSGHTVNKHLAIAAQKVGIPVGLGSCKVLFYEPEFLNQFQVREFAPDVPILANLGAVQIEEIGISKISEMIKRLEVDSFVIHLNSGQEMFQPHGDRDFRTSFEAIKMCRDELSLPVIVKETGFGFSKRDAQKLDSIGVSYIDAAGSGGTNWVAVEAYRNVTDAQEYISSFADWGTPTALVLSLLSQGTTPFLASGGLRSGMDGAKSISLGAHLAGYALPVIQAEAEGGIDKVVDLFNRYARELRAVMLLTGSRSTEDLKKADRWYTDSFLSASRQLGGR